MQELNFTDEERKYISAITSEQNRRAKRGFYVAVLVPTLLFAANGVWKNDFGAMTIAFLGLLSFVVWRLWAEKSYSKVFYSIMSKIEEHEKNKNARGA